ncbi:hypothetical protein KC319_g48 [Hortaea werneckii]|nr:hypothetical protein KC319_g48 [Hortaea werneckii]
MTRRRRLPDVAEKLEAVSRASTSTVPDTLSALAAAAIHEVIRRATRRSCVPRAVVEAMHAIFIRPACGFLWSVYIVSPVAPSQYFCSAGVKFLEKYAFGCILPLCSCVKQASIAKSEASVLTCTGFLVSNSISVGNCMHACLSCWNAFSCFSVQMNLVSFFARLVSVRKSQNGLDIRCISWSRPFLVGLYFWVHSDSRKFRLFWCVLEVHCTKSF